MRFFLFFLLVFPVSAVGSELSASGEGFGKVTYGYGYHERVANLKRGKVDEIRGYLANEFGRELGDVKVYGFVEIRDNVYAVYAYVSNLKPLNGNSSGDIGELFYIDFGEKK